MTPSKIGTWLSLFSWNSMIWPGKWWCEIDCSQHLELVENVVGASKIQASTIDEAVAVINGSKWTNIGVWEVVAFVWCRVSLYEHLAVKDHSKNPYPLRNHIILNKASIRAQETWGCMGPWQLRSWELCDFSMGIGSCFYPMTHRNEGHWVLGNVHV